MVRVALLLVVLAAGAGALFAWKGKALTRAPATTATSATTADEPKGPAVGSASPQFDVKSVNGKEDIKLSAYKGKYVLLDFWATWCVPCLAEVPSIKAVHDEFAKDNRLVIISLSLDETPEDARKYAVNNGMVWPQGFIQVADDGSAPVKDAYGVDEIPSIWLIGPDGKVIARDLLGDGIAAAVKKALAQ